MIVKVNHPAGDHYHICDGCEMESSPDECIDSADECVDILCTPCTALRVPTVFREDKNDQTWTIFCIIEYSVWNSICSGLHSEVLKMELTFDILSYHISHGIECRVQIGHQEDGVEFMRSIQIVCIPCDTVLFEAAAPYLVTEWQNRIYQTPRGLNL